MLVRHHKLDFMTALRPLLTALLLTTLAGCLPEEPVSEPDPAAVFEGEDRDSGQEPSPETDDATEPELSLIHI